MTTIYSKTGTDSAIPAAVAAEVTDPASATSVALSSTYVAKGALISPDDFAGTDAQRVQAAVSYSIANGFPHVAFARMYDLTGAAPISIDKTPWSDRRELKLIGMGGGIRKDDAGAIFTSATADTGDVRTIGMKFQSVSGAGAVVWDGDKLIRIMTSNCSYANVDRIILQDDPTRGVQSFRMSQEHVIGGAGPALEFCESYDMTIQSNLFEDRTAAIWNVAPTEDKLINRNLRLIDNCMENMSGIPVKLAATWGCVIGGNYFEQNGDATGISPATGTPAHIDLHTLRPTMRHYSLSITSNMFSMRTTQKAALTVAVLLGRSLPGGGPYSTRANVADGGTLFKFGDLANADAITDGTDTCQGGGDTIYPAHAAKYRTSASSLVDAKGDLLAGSSDNTLVRLAVGASGATLLADSAQASGIRWSSALRLEGAGSPIGVVSAPVGSTYTDTAATIGASLWVKRAGLGNTGWEVAHGDTGWRNVSSLLSNGWTGTVYARRTTLGIAIQVEALNGAAATATTVVTLPAGFRPPHSERMSFFTTAPAFKRFGLDSAGALSLTGVTPEASGNLYGNVFVTSGNDWPTTLPGIEG